jgi:hypothetical protein
VDSDRGPKMERTKTGKRKIRKCDCERIQEVNYSRKKGKLMKF